MTKISIIELENIFKRFIEKLKFEEDQNISFDEDFYRFIPTDEWTSFKEDIIEHGSLVDDIENLKKLMLETRPCTYVDFDRLASVLKAISQKNNPV